MLVFRQGLGLELVLLELALGLRGQQLSKVYMVRREQGMALLGDVLVDEVQDGVEHKEQYLPRILHRLRTHFHRHGKLRFEHVHRVRRLYIRLM